MLQFYDKSLAASVLALAALASPTSADTDDPATLAACSLSDGYAADLFAFAREAEACLDRPISADLDDRADTILTLTDRAREKAAAKPLIRRESLADAARAHAMDMASRGYAAHADDNGRGHLERVRILDRTGIYGATGANVSVVDAGLDATEIYSLLASDPVNAANLSREAFTHAGIGMAEAGGRLYVVQVFGQLDGELAEPLPIGLPDAAPVDVRFTDPAFSLANWRLEDADGVRVRRGTTGQLVRTGEEAGALFLVIQAELGGVVHSLKGPAMTADTNGAAS